MVPLRNKPKEKVSKSGNIGACTNGIGFGVLGSIRVLGSIIFDLYSGTPQENCIGNYLGPYITELDYGSLIGPFKASL